MTDRLQVFRAYMERLNPAVDPRRAIDDGLYVEPAERSPGREIADRLVLRPRSTILLLGGVGAGKTTALWAAAQLLEQRRRKENLGFIASYIDVSAGGNLDLLEKVSFLDLVKDSFAESIGRLPNDETWNEDGARNYAVLLLDALDRLTDPARFAQLLRREVPALSSSGFGVVVTGPLSILYSEHRDEIHGVDHLMILPFIDVEQDSAGAAHLDQILQIRADQALLPQESRAELVRWSGGVVRDLIALAQSAGEEAYLSGASRIEPRHVEIVARTFGRNLLLGLSREELHTLDEVHRTGEFFPLGEKAVQLLLSRRVLEYRGEAARYVVHPTIAPFIQRLAQAS